MLRRAHTQQGRQQQQQQHQEGSRRGDGNRILAEAPRSLEALLCDNAGRSAAEVVCGGSRGGERRSSASSDWSPPPSGAENGTPSHVGGGVRRQRGLYDGNAGTICRGGGGLTEVHSVSAERGTDREAAAAVAVAAAKLETCAWGASSNPPTPARMSFEKGEGHLTPSVEGSVGMSTEGLDR